MADQPVYRFHIHGQVATAEKSYYAINKVFALVEQALEGLSDTDISNITIDVPKDIQMSGRHITIRTDPSRGRAEDYDELPF